jgi:cytochrome c-type biogenesis protein CcmF
LLRVLAWPIGVAIVAGVALVAAGAGSSKPGLIAYTFSAFVLATIAVELVRGTRATGSLLQLVTRNRRRYGGYVVHASIVLLALGIAGSSAYGSVREQKLLPGQSMTVAGHTVTYRRLEHERSGVANETRAVLDLSGDATGTIRSGVNQYFTGDSSREVGIKTDWLRAEDTYVIFDQQDGRYVYFKVLIKPLVNLIWLAGFVFLAGSLVALWPDAREQRRLVARLALARG